MKKKLILLSSFLTFSTCFLTTYYGLNPHENQEFKYIVKTNKSNNLNLNKTIKFQIQNTNDKRKFELEVNSGTPWRGKKGFFPKENTENNLSSWKEINFTASTEFINNYFLGDWNNSGKYVNNLEIKLLNKVTNPKIFLAKDLINEGAYGIFSYINKKLQIESLDETEPIIFNNNENWENEIINFNCQKNGGRDYIKLYSKSSLGYKDKWKTLFLKNNFILEAYEYEDWTTDWSTSYISYEILFHSFNIDTAITLPYTQYDVNVFKEKFKDLVGQPIVLNNVKDPIVFGYSEGGDNEQRVIEIIKNRSNIFFNDNDIINSKLGPISLYNSQTQTYNANPEAGNIEYLIEKSERGKKGPVTMKIRYQLPAGRTFEHFDDKNYFEWKVEVSTKLAIDEDYTIDKLVTITPYKGASNGYRDNFKTKDYLNCRIGQNSPEPNIISTKKININEAKYLENNSNENLIPIEKFPVISKAGTIANITLKINLGSYQFEETIQFNRIFINGKIYVDHIIKNDLYLNSNGLKIKNDQLKLGLELTDSKVNLFFVENPQLILNNQEINLNSCSIDVSSVKISIPSEQVSSSSKWIQIEPGKFIKDINDENNIIRYVGTYEVFDPFFFTMINKMIDVYDPVTLKPLGTFSQYKPYIVDGTFDLNNQTINQNAYPIYPSASSNNEDSIFKANLGPYIMTKKIKDQSTLEFCIVIKEFDRTSKETNIEQRYTKPKWVLNVRMNLLNEKTDLKMIGYSNNENINQINDQKYFNKEDIENYRGDFANRDTGMYIPKIVWVNAYPSEAFLYDPRDKNGQLIVPLDDDGTMAANAKYDIGYLAELNGTAFASGDYTTNETFGGFEILFDESKFTPTGLIPYIEKYTFNKNSLEPLIEKISLSSSGFQYVDSSSDFAQIVLKRPNSNTFLFQFFKINTRNEILKYRHDLISIYGNRNGLKGQPLFVDFWQTYHGTNLKNYLLEKKLIENEEKISELEYHDVVQYWNIYVNDPNNYNGISLEGNNIAKFEPNLGYGIIGPLNKNQDLRDVVINMIIKKLNEVLYREGWIKDDLYYNKNDLDFSNFRIEENSDIFESKINQLMAQYDKNLLEAQIIDFNVIINDNAFKDKPIKVTGKNSFSILYNKNANNIIDLSQYKGVSLLINSTSNYFSQNNQYLKVEQIEKEIRNSLNKDLREVMKIYGSKIGLENYLPQENLDYRLKFHDSFGYYYKDLEEAIRICLISGENLDYFNNNLFIEVEALFDNKSHFMKNSFTKIINNNSKNEALSEIENFNLSTIKANDLKINTTKDGHLNEINYWLSSDDIDTKARGIWNLLLNRVQNDVNLYSRKWSNAYNKKLVYGLNYEIKIIQNIDKDNNVIYYEANDENEYLAIIKKVLLENIENEIQTFNKNLIFHIQAINNSNYNSYTIGSFTKEVNNSYLNQGIEDDSESTSLISDSNSIINLNNKPQNDDGISLWWVITPLTIFAILGSSLVAAMFVRKNRRIR